MSLWKCFSELVTTLLLPLAESEITHPDIRPGYDWTSNILVNESDGKKL